MKNIYIQYFKYILEHKKNVFEESMLMARRLTGKSKWAMIIHAFTHDLSKFSIKEFNAYAEWFYGYFGVGLRDKYNIEQLTNGESCLSQNYLECRHNFENAWKHHYLNNRHHWQYWCGYDNDDDSIIYFDRMPDRYILQMICDWEAMGYKSGQFAEDYYLHNYKKIGLHRESRLALERYLEILPAKFLKDIPHCGMSLKDIVLYCLEHEKYHEPTRISFRDGLLPYFKDKYKIDLLTIL